MRTVCAHEELLRGGLAACRLVCWCIWTGDFKIVCVCVQPTCVAISSLAVGWQR